MSNKNVAVQRGYDKRRQASDFREFEAFESNVRSYCRDFPVLLGRAKGSRAYSVDEVAYIDFFMGAGALNYGHNCDPLKARLLAYIEKDGITHSLDFYTNAKKEFIQAFQENILTPRKLEYKLQFTGPTGTNAVEAALKLARKVTRRTNVIAFTNAFHGMSLGSLSATASPKKRRGSGMPLAGVTFMPYDGYLGDGVDSIDYISRMLADGGGVDAPAAFLVETIQGEGGLRMVGKSWLQRLAALARDCGALLIVDDIQSGCGRSGRFFSFEGMDVEPDIVVLSKSLSGYGLPFSMNLLKPEHDLWEPAEHNGTFRGNNLAFVTGKAALELFWATPAFETELARKVDYLDRRLGQLLERIRQAVPRAEVRGRGFMQGVYLGDGELAAKVSQEAFRLGLIVETCGPQGEVVKLLPALTIEDEVLREGLDLLESAFGNVLWPKLVSLGAA
ncbi:MAG TPA: diaminobutyrate--2-oxoglutarate transaminase [Paucimonas sp.]|nr:diaminobutyrate--2-oxoglutarate transaminase [Paucimonas sp.]